MTFQRALTALGGAALLLGLAGCSGNAPEPKAAGTGRCADIQEPGWIYDPYVGVARMTASGNRNDQKRIALERAIADLLMTKGVARGTSVMNATKDLSVHNDKERFVKHFNADTEMKIVYKQIAYDIRVTDIWRNPCTDELYVKIEEK